MSDPETPPDGWNYSGDYDPENWLEPMPPFPQEPEIGSPEAVALAAETVRRFAGAHKIDPNGPLVYFDDYNHLLRERDAEVERLRTEICVEIGLRETYERQRDAIADALALYVRNGSCYSGGFHPKEHSCRYCHGLAALRLAGRLPTTTKGEPNGNV